MRPYAMNAMRRPSTPLKMMAVISPYLACTHTNTRLSIVRTVAATTVSAGCQWRAAEHEALDRQDRGGHHRERRMPVEGGGDDQPDRADEFEDAEGHPGFPRQRTKGRDPLAYLVEHEDLHDARRSVQEI